MEALVKKLLTRLKTETSRIEIVCNAVKGYDQCAGIAKSCLAELMEYISVHPTTDEASEIYYLKHAIPSICSWSIYFTRMYNLEIRRRTASPDDFISFVSKQLEEVCSFFEVYGELHRYYYSQRDIHDQILFTKKGCQQSSEDIANIIDASLCPNSVNLSIILAFEKYRIMLKKEQDSSCPSTNLSIKKAEWKGSKADLVELIVALYEERVIYIDNQPASLFQIKEMQESVYDIDLKEYDVIDYKNRSRKKTDAPFLSRLTRCYLSRKDRLIG